ncbi:MAG: gamma-glutamyl hercynylcysteine S-oxide synthase [Solirubrobacteraceae bacterium]|jgi:iron(II)-dependent oxidoreductase|nr:gamma-glutamyl hercynylcysteine S-oxide synthase [Solirubrobacteraceae bacterium]
MTRVAAPEELVGALEATRERTLALVSDIPDSELERVHSPLMSPLVWDLGHIAAFEDLWLVHRFGGEPMVRRDLAEVYDAFETPRSGRGELPFLRPQPARDYLDEVRARALDATERRGVGDGVLHELVVRHELQHTETMLQTMGLARLRCFEPPEGLPPATPAGGLELVDVPGGRHELGAGPDGFAYDNERPRHGVEVAPFRLGRTPVSNATWLAFAEGGGYQRREWWSDEAWHWKEQYDITHPLHWSGDGHEWRTGGWEPLDPDKPAVHVSWFEADAFATAHGARLPTEAEWERAATWDQGGLDHLGWVWEWTAGEFGGYPGFAAFPYPEYSEVFFGQGYRVLRGGSWATSPRVATSTFRNWDHPDRRQIFAGVRIARDA